MKMKCDCFKNERYLDMVIFTEKIVVNRFQTHAKNLNLRNGMNRKKGNAVNPQRPNTARTILGRESVPNCYFICSIYININIYIYIYTYIHTFTYLHIYIHKYK